MWVQDLDEVCDLLKGYFPFYLLVFVPLLIIISPVGAAHEFPVYRMHQYDLHGVPHGCRSAGVNMEARSVRSWSTNRHCVLTGMTDLTQELFQAIKAKAGALIVVLPKDMKQPSAQMLELEFEMMSEPVPIPVYFAPWSEALQSIADEVAAQPAQQAATALEAAVSQVAATGYQLVIPSSSPAPREGGVVTLQGTLLGRSMSESTPAIVVVAHMDSLGSAPELSFGGDSNASGVAVLLELARIFSVLYSNSRTHGRYNIIFLVTGGGKMNYLGTKKYLEDNIDSTEGTMLHEAVFVLCLDSIGRNKTLHLHVSKPPREGTIGGALWAAALQASGNSLRMVHKKINLADDLLSWEHERYSMRRFSAFTFSGITNHRDPVRTTIFDNFETIDLNVLERHASVIAESLARVVYNVSGVSVLGGQLRVEREALRNSLRVLCGAPRSAVLLASPPERPAPTVAAVRDLLARHVSEVRTMTLMPDRRDPDVVLYDTTASILNVYSVKPAVFDLLLTVMIVAYLALVYLVLVYFPDLYVVVSGLVSSKKKIS